MNSLLVFQFFILLRNVIEYRYDRSRSYAFDASQLQGEFYRPELYRIVVYLVARLRARLGIHQLPDLSGKESGIHSLLQQRLPHVRYHVPVAFDRHGYLRILLRRFPVLVNFHFHYLCMLESGIPAQAHPDTFLGGS